MAYRPKRFRRRPHHLRFRPRGFSDPVGGPIYRGLLNLLGIKREDRRQVYNLLALCLGILMTIGLSVSAFFSGGIGSGIGRLLSGLVIGWIVFSILRFLR